MNRRGMLRSAVSALGTASFMTAAAAAAHAGPKSSGAYATNRPIAGFVNSMDGAELFYRAWGSGRTVLFLAPWGLHSDWWEYQMAYLADHGMRCIAVDRRGHGRSTESGAGYEFDTLADDIHALITQLNLQDITIIGQSVGCGEIVRYLSRHREARIRNIVMIAPITPFILKTADNPDGVDAATLAYVRSVLSTDRPQAIAAAAPAFFNVPKNAVSTEMRAWWTNMLLQCPLQVLLDLHRTFTVTDFRTELRAISLPTLIIHGDADTSTPIERTGRKTAALIRDSRLFVYEGAAHGLPISHMQRLNHDLLELATDKPV